MAASASSTTTAMMAMIRPWLDFFGCSAVAVREPAGRRPALLIAAVTGLAVAGLLTVGAGLAVAAGLTV